MIQTLGNAAATGSAYVLIAIGLTMVYGLLRILHVAHAAVYTLGAFVGFKVWAAGGGLGLGLAAAALTCGLVGAAIFDGVYRHLVGRPPIVPLIVSIGMLVLAETLYQQPFFFGPQQRAFTPAGGIPSLRTPWLQLTSEQVTLILASLASIALLALVLGRTRLGLEWRAMAEDAPMADAVGIPVRRSMILNFVLGSALAGIGGLLVAAYDGRVFATMGAVASYKAFVVVVMGGLGNVWGAVVAAYILAVLETLVISLWGYLLPRDAIAFAILVIVLMFRPQGLFARSR
ncbi:MAG TPA: branched-chain amino acid ABC transporter permease [Bacillota bacterium]